MIGIAHSSPSVSGVTDWYAATKRASVRDVDAAVAVRDRLERDVVHARQAAGRALRQVRKAPAVFLAAGAAGRCGSALRSGRSCRAAIRPTGAMRSRDLTASVSMSKVSIRTRSFSSSRSSSRVRGPRRAEDVGRGQGLAVLLHLLDAEQFRAQRRLVVRAACPEARAAHAVAQCRGSAQESAREESAAHRRKSSRYGSFSSVLRGALFTARHVSPTGAGRGDAPRLCATVQIAAL